MTIIAIIITISDPYDIDRNKQFDKETMNYTTYSKQEQKEKKK